jgi:hypothetical protein
MIRGACIALVCLALGGYIGNQIALNEFSKLATEAQRKSK